MALKGKAPEPTNKRFKLFYFGPEGCGKTTAAMQFPNNYIFDLEKGTENYGKTIKKMGSVVYPKDAPMGFDDIVKEIKELASTPHPYLTCTIDPITTLYERLQEKWTTIFVRYEKDQKNKDLQDFGFRYWAKVKSEWKAFRNLMLTMDMNVLWIAHQKDQYNSQMAKVGFTFDSMKDDGYLFDNVFRVEKRGQDLIALRLKERVDILSGDKGFPDEFPWSYANITQYFDKEAMEREVKTIQFATKEEIETVNSLIKALNIPDEAVAKSLDKRKVESFEEMTHEDIQSVIQELKDRLESIK